uniref:Uncharacterized protein n=1 Tax=Ciona savignyi TaxID=51511 RepID=H2ZBG1_CIOSA
MACPIASRKELQDLGKNGVTLPGRQASLVQNAILSAMKGITCKGDPRTNVCHSTITEWPSRLRCQPTERPPNFPTGLSGPYKFSPHSAEDEYLSADENRRLVSTLVPQEHGQYFEVMEPGMISAPGSITFTSRRFLGNYLVVQGIR